MELETGASSSRRDRLKEALIHRNYSRQCEEERKPMATHLSPYVEDVVNLIVDEDLPYDELRQILDDRMNVDSSFVSKPFDGQEFPETLSKPLDKEVPEIVSEPLFEQVSGPALESVFYESSSNDNFESNTSALRQVFDDRMQIDSSFVSEAFKEQEVPEIVSEAFDQLLPEIVSEPFLEQACGSVAEPEGTTLEVGPALKSVPYETSATCSDKSESHVSESDENSTIDEAGSHYSIDDSGDIQEFIGEVTFTSFMEDEDEIEVHLGETSIILERMGGIKDINPANHNKVAEDDDESEVTCVSADDNTVDTDEYDSDASWTSDSPLPELYKESPLPELFKEFMFQRLTLAASEALNASADIATWF
jgi:hypothetical protein